MSSIDLSRVNTYTRTNYIIRGGFYTIWIIRLDEALELELRAVTLRTPEQLKERMPTIKKLFKREVNKGENGVLGYDEDAIGVRHLNFIERDDLFEQELTKFSVYDQSIVETRVGPFYPNNLPVNREQLIISYLREDSPTNKSSLYRELIQNFTYDELTNYIGIDRLFSAYMLLHYRGGNVPIVLIRGGYTHNLQLAVLLFHTLSRRVFNYNILRSYQDDLRAELNKLYLTYYEQDDSLSKDYLRWIHRCELELGWDMGEERIYYEQIQKIINKKG